MLRRELESGWWEVNMYEERENRLRRRKRESSTPGVKKKIGREGDAKGRIEMSGRKSQNMGPENKVSIFSPLRFIFLSHPADPRSPSHPIFPLLLQPQIWYSSQQSPSNNLPEVPATWKSITVIRHFCQANRNGGSRLCARGLLLLILRVRRGQSCPRWWKKGGGDGGGERSVTKKRTRWERKREKKMQVTGTEQCEEAWEGAGERVGGWDGCAYCREEVICQIGFHSLLGLRAACQPGRLTVSDSPRVLARYTHTHKSTTHTHFHIHTGEKLTPNDVSAKRTALSEWNAFAAVPQL